MGVNNVRETTKIIEIQCVVPTVKEIHRLDLDTYS